MVVASSVLPPCIHNPCKAVAAVQSLCRMKEALRYFYLCEQSLFHWNTYFQIKHLDWARAFDLNC